MAISPNIVVLEMVVQWFYLSVRWIVWDDWVREAEVDKP